MLWPVIEKPLLLEAFRFPRNKKSVLRKKTPLSALLLSIFLICYGFFLFLIADHSLSYPNISPSKLQFYPSDCDFDLKRILCSEMQQAQKSISLSSFGIFDNEIIENLKEKQKQGLLITLFDDKKQSKSKLRAFKNCIVVKPCKGLYHRKWLITDKKRVFLGSTNCSLSSLLVHDNLLVGLESPGLAQALENNETFTNDFLTLFPLPSYSDKALAKLLEAIDGAKQRIIIAMYTFTHPKIIEHLIKAHKRGIPTTVFMDSSMAKGICRKTTQTLLSEGIQLRVNVKTALIHHKSALIDDLFISGSTNWTQAGFGKNEELIFFYTPPDPSHLAPIKKMIKRLYLRSKKLRP